jgi:hypothetical protein
MAVGANHAVQERGGRGNGGEVAWSSFALESAISPVIPADAQASVLMQCDNTGAKM